MKEIKIEPNKTVWFLKAEIKEGQIAEFESLQRGTISIYLILLALANEETKIIKTTYKELVKLTSYAKDTVNKRLKTLIEAGYIEKLSKQGSRKSVFKLL